MTTFVQAPPDVIDARTRRSIIAQVRADTLSVDRGRAHETIFAGMKVVVVDDDSLERERCIDAGADDYVSKPVDVIPFLALLTRWGRAAHRDNKVAGADATIANASGSSVGPTLSKPALKGIFDGVKVLVVDAAARNLFAMAARLEEDDAVVVTAGSGPDALMVLERHPDVDLLLVDVTMAGMDGLAAMRAIRRVDRLRSLPIIAVTANAVPGERERCVDAGANDYVSRPIDVVAFVKTIIRWSNRRNG
jgi:CheY-like chemotaxis protein